MHIYKICTRAVWEETERTGIFPGMPVDTVDGYIHFSTAEQQPETARKYFNGQRDLMLLTVDATMLADSLKWEASSSGTRAGLFPHLYGALPLSAVVKAEPFAV